MKYCDISVYRCFLTLLLLIHGVLSQLLVQLHCHWTCQVHLASHDHGCMKNLPHAPGRLLQKTLILGLQKHLLPPVNLMLGCERSRPRRDRVVSLYWELWARMFSTLCCRVTGVVIGRSACWKLLISGETSGVAPPSLLTTLNGAYVFLFSSRFSPFVLDVLWLLFSSPSPVVDRVIFEGT